VKLSTPAWALPEGAEAGPNPRREASLSTVAEPRMPSQTAVLVRGVEQLTAGA
jgi:hypothetical protein